MSESVRGINNDRFTPIHVIAGVASPRLSNDIFSHPNLYVENLSIIWIRIHKPVYMYFKISPHLVSKYSCCDL